MITKQQVENATREELAEWTALYVMGWYVSNGDFIELDEKSRPPNLISGVVKYLSPSTDIKDAWEIVEKMTVKDGKPFRTFSMNRCPDWYDPAYGYEVVFGLPYKQGRDNKRQWARTAPEAICKAALLAVIAESEDKNVAI